MQPRNQLLGTARSSENVPKVFLHPKAKAVKRAAPSTSCIIAPMKILGVWILLLPLGGIYAAGRPVQLADYYRVETAGTPAISPDGRWVVFVRNTTVEAENQHHSELWISPSDGSTPAIRL